MEKKKSPWALGKWKINFLKYGKASFFQKSLLLEINCFARAFVVLQEPNYLEERKSPAPITVAASSHPVLSEVRGEIERHLQRPTRSLKE